MTYLEWLLVGVAFGGPIGIILAFGIWRSVERLQAKRLREQWAEMEADLRAKVVAETGSWQGWGEQGEWEKVHGVKRPIDEAKVWWQK
jgi:hypothetical protein